MTLFAGFTEYMPGRNRGTWSSRVSFIGNWSYPLCSLIAMGLTPLISAEMELASTVVDPGGAVAHSNGYCGAVSLSRLAGWSPAGATPKLKR